MTGQDAMRQGFDGGGIVDGVTAGNLEGVTVPYSRVSSEARR